MPTNFMPGEDDWLQAILGRGRTPMMPGGMPQPMAPPQAPPQGGIMGLLNKPGMQDMALALLSNSGYGPKRSFGEILGTSALQARQMGQGREDDAFKRKYMEAQMAAMGGGGNDLKAIIGPDGKPKYVRASDAVDQQPYSPMQRAEAPASMQELESENASRRAKGQPELSIAEYLKLRASFTPIAPSVQMIGNVPTLTQPTDRTGRNVVLNPLSTPQTELDAAAKLAAEKAAGSAQGAITGDRAAKNPRSYEVYKAGIAGLETALEGTVTGPVAGRVPAMTASQQTAEGAESIMAPVLKQLFRDSGEGTFTEGDQKLLMDMLPTRKDHPETRKFKLGMIDSIVKAKLGISDQRAPPPGLPAQIFPNQPKQPTLEEIRAKYGR